MGAVVSSSSSFVDGGNDVVVENRLRGDSTAIQTLSTIEENDETYIDAGVFGIYAPTTTAAAESQRRKKKQKQIRVDDQQGRQFRQMYKRRQQQHQENHYCRGSSEMMGVVEEDGHPLRNCRP